MSAQHTPHIGDQVPLSKNGVPKGLALGRGPLGDHSNDPYPEPERGPLGDHSSCEPERGPARDHSRSNPKSKGTRLPTENDGSRCKADDEGIEPQRDTSESGAICERTVAPQRRQRIVIQIHGEDFELSNTTDPLLTVGKTAQMKVSAPR